MKTNDEKRNGQVEKINWKEPTREDLALEWDTETMDSIWFPGYPSESEKTRYKNQFLDNIDKFAKPETINPEEISSQLYEAKSADKLAENINHMCKDVPAIDKSIVSGSPVMPLLMRENKKLKIIGGRTRVSLALMHGGSITGLVIDKQKMEEAFYPVKKEDFIAHGWGFSAFEAEATRKEIIDYVEGKRETPPALKCFEGKEPAMEKKEIERIKKHLSFKPSEIKPTDKTPTKEDPVEFAQPASKSLTMTKGKVVIPDDIPKWFGESKVVDKKGKPLIVFHGTTSQFDEFDTRALKQMGSHFTPNANMAGGFALGNHGRVVAAYLAIKNPYDIVSDLGDWSDMETLEEYLGEANEGPFSVTEFAEFKTPEDVQRGLIKKGYDGLKYQNSCEGEPHSNMGDELQDVYVAFNPNQIKSIVSLKIEERQDRYRHVIVTALEAAAKNGVSVQEIKKLMNEHHGVFAALGFKSIEELSHYDHVDNNEAAAPAGPAGC